MYNKFNIYLSSYIYIFVSQQPHIPSHLGPKPIIGDERTIKKRERTIKKRETRKTRPRSMKSVEKPHFTYLPRPGIEPGTTELKRQESKPSYRRSYGSDYIIHLLFLFPLIFLV